MEITLTDEEIELIAAIRNFKSSKHNKSSQLEWYAKEQFDNLMYGNSDDDSDEDD